MDGCRGMLGGFQLAKKGGPLGGHSQAAGHQFSRQASWKLGLGQWHKILLATRVQHYNLKSRRRTPEALGEVELMDFGATAHHF